MGGWEIPPTHVAPPPREQRTEIQNHDTEGGLGSSTRRDAREELDAATARYGSARDRLQQLGGAAAASQRAAELARRRYEGGVADLLDVLDAERTLLLAQDQRTQAQLEAADAYVRLYEARGGRWR